MSEERKDALELLSIMKDLNGQGFRLNNEIVTTVYTIMESLDIPKRPNEYKIDKLNIKGHIDNKLIGKLEKGIKKMGSWTK